MVLTRLLIIASKTRNISENLKGLESCRRECIVRMCIMQISARDFQRLFGCKYRLRYHLRASPAKFARSLCIDTSGSFVCIVFHWQIRPHRTTGVVTFDSWESNVTTPAPLGSHESNRTGELTSKICKMFTNWKSLVGSFSAVSKRNFARKYAFGSSRRDLHNALLLHSSKSTFFKKQNVRIVFENRNNLLVR